MYTWGDESDASPPPITTEAVTALQNVVRDSSGPFASLEQDCVATMPQAGETDDIGQGVGEIQHEVFREAAGVAFTRPDTLVPTIPTYVAVLDTLPSGKLADMLNLKVQNEHPLTRIVDPFLYGRDDHGFTIWKIIDDLTSYANASPGKPIVKFAEVHAELALANVDNNKTDKVNGGQFGRTSQFTQAVCKAVDAWDAYEEKMRAEHPNASIPPLVLTAALGAEPLPGMECGSADAIKHAPLATQAMFAALKHAACRGAAIVAAAGNDPDGTVSTNPACREAPGPTCPGGMGLIPAPTADECAQMYDAVADYHATNYHLHEPQQGEPPIPLLYVVSATDPSGAPIPQTRPGGLGAYAAVGTQGAAKDITGQWHAARSGTSISTAVWAAAFATLFAYRPDLDAATAAQIIYQSGLPTNALADSYNPAEFTEPPVVRQISICAALESLAKKDGVQMDLGCTPKLAPKGANIIHDNGLAETLDKAIKQSFQLPVYGPTAGNDSPTQSVCSGHPPDEDPTPGSHSCPDCKVLLSAKKEDGSTVVGSTGSVFIKLAKGNGQAFSNVTVVLRGSGAVPKKETFQLSNFGFAPGSTFSLVGIDSTILPEELTSATIELVAERGSKKGALSGEIPILIK